MLKHEAVAEEVLVWIRKHYYPDCCIDATRMVVRCAKELRFPAQPVSVAVRVLNPQMTKHGRLPHSDEESQQWAKEGCWAVILGSLNTPPSGPDMWPGHLAVRVNGNTLLDLTVTQANRPGTGIDVGPVMFTCEDQEFWEGRSAAVVESGDCLIIYTVHMEDRSWSNATGWHKKNAEEIQELTRRARESLRCGKTTGSSSTTWRGRWRKSATRKLWARST